MPQFHLGVLESGGIDLGAIAFLGFVIAQLFAVIMFRHQESKRTDRANPRPIAEKITRDCKSSLAETAPQIS